MTNFISNNDVFRIAGLSSTAGPVSANDVDALIPSAQLEAARLLATTFVSDTTVGSAVTDELYDGNDTSTLKLKRNRINSVTSLSYTTDYGTTYSSITVTKLWINSVAGIIILKPTAETVYFPKGIQNIKVSYKHGVVPGDDHKWLMAALCALKVLVEQMGGTYSHSTNFSLPEMSGAVGDESDDVLKTINSLKTQINSFIERYPRDPVVM
jgi:hypothetical protein